MVAYAVSQREKEIGLRMALGALPWDVTAVVALQFRTPIVAGLIGGVAGAAAVSRLLRERLYGVSTIDPLAYGLASALLVVTAGLAVLIPARRAAQVEPMRALRSE